MSQGYLPYSGHGAHGPQRRARTPFGAVALGFAWAVAGVFCLGLVVLMAQMLVPYLSVVTGPLFGLLLLVAAAEAARQVRRQRAMTILSYLEQAIRLNLPLPTMLASAERAETGATRNRLVGLREVLLHGVPLGNSLAATVPEVSERTLGLIYTAERTGTLPQTLRRILDDNRRRPTFSGAVTDPMNAAFQRIYPLAVALVMSIVVSLFLVFVMPKFEKIFRDFKLELPPITRVVMDFGGALAVPVAIVLGLIGLFIIGRAFERLLVTRTPLRGALGRLGDVLLWYTPIAGQAARDNSLADLFQTLGDATAGGMPLDQALAEAEWLHVNTVLAGRIRYWRDAMQRGLLPAESACEAELPNFACGLLQTARAAQDASAVYQFLARYYRSRFSRLQALLSGAFLPAVALVMGACVGTVALAMFVPMLRLINSVAPHVGGL